MKRLSIGLIGAARRTYQRIRGGVMPILNAWSVPLKFFLRSEGKRHGLPSTLIVSLTSYPARFGTLHLTLKCLLSQSVAPDRVILWIAHSDRPYLTPAILKLQKVGLQIEFCDDLLSYKKIIPALRCFPSSFIVTADDDLHYWSTWLEELINGYQEDPSGVICHRAHRIQLGADKLPAAYNQWEFETLRTDSSALNFQTGGAGALYPPNSLHL